MKITQHSNYKGGWFIGNFDPSVLKVENFEVCYKTHKKDEIWETHYHKIATEINLLIEGEMLIQNKNLKCGDIFCIYPYEISDPKFLTDCKILIVKIPSVPNDKFII